jgi:hypothetical protein
MSELEQVLQTLKQPEYVHVLLNPMPVYGLSCGVLGLIIALLLKSRPAQLVGLIMVIVACASVWPVVRSGRRGYDRVYSMSNAAGQQWLDVHEDRAEGGQWVFFATGLVALATSLIPRKFPRTATVLVILTLMVSLVALGTGAWISHAGGQVRHAEFRNGPPPKIEKDEEWPQT